jgi:hypothetical protein
MSERVTQEEWSRFSSGRLDPSDALDVSRRAKRFGVEGESPTSAAASMRASALDDADDHADFRAYVDGTAPSEVRERVDAMRAVNPAVAEALAAIESGKRQVEAARSMRSSPFPVVRKPSLFSVLFGATGWVAAAGAAVFCVVLLNREVPVERVDKGTVVAPPVTAEPDDLGLHFPPTSLERIIAGDGEFVSKGGGLRFSSPPDPAVQDIMNSGKMPVRQDLMPPSYRTAKPAADGVLPARTYVLPRFGLEVSVPSDARRAWLSHIVGDRRDELASGVPEGGVWLAEAELRIVGSYAVTMEVGAATSEFRFDVPPLGVLTDLLVACAGARDPLSRAVALAERGFFHDAIAVLESAKRRGGPAPEIDRLTGIIQSAWNSPSEG